MKNTLETRLGIFFALALVATFLLMEVAGSLNYFQKGMTISARFDNVRDLKRGDPVKMAGVEIGRVLEIGFEGSQVDVSMRLTAQGSDQVRTTSIAAVKFVGLMGQNYVDISFGTSEGLPVEPSTVLETVEQPDLSSLMAKLDGVATGVERMTDTFSGEKITDILGPFADFLQENNPKLAAILGNMQNISTQVAEGDGTVGKLIYDNALYDSALTTITNIGDAASDIQVVIDDAQVAIKDARSIVSRINAGEGTLGKITTEETLYNETTIAMSNLREILEKLNQGHGSIGALINDPSFIKNATVTLQKVDKATETLEDQGPLSVIGLAVGSLF